MITIIIIIALIAIIWIAKKRKKIKMADVSMITGGVKTGKSTLTFYLAYRKYRSILFRWRVASFFAKIRRKPKPEKPLLYSNIPLSVPHVPLTREVFLREVRPAFKSVAFVDEASLIADSQDWRDVNVNERLKMFNKLWGHETHGGAMFYDTHVMRDVHYSIKRAMSNYLWIHHAIKWIPFFYVVQVREMFYSEEGEVMNVSDDDVEKRLYWIAIPKSIWKKFDCYCYSVLTDSLPVKDDVLCAKNKKELKTDYIINVAKQRKDV